MVFWSFPRGHTWGRIETEQDRKDSFQGFVSPGVTPGGGLKHKNTSAPGTRRNVSPGVTPGGGLKHYDVSFSNIEGLKFPPGSHLGAD